jgi:tRNA threonylcarbamoyladenosine biosynthesis protein TsaB
VNILAIDTSTEACSAALLRADGQVFGEFEVAPRQHTRLLPAMMDRVLLAAGIPKDSISHCAFANGPGAFTGIRIAAAQAQGIGIALDIPLLPISTLAVLAQTGIDRYDCKTPLVALDARMQEIYWALYQRDDKDLARLVGREWLTSVDAVEFNGKVDCGIGHGWLGELRAGASFDVDAGLLPDARSLLKLARSTAQAKQGVKAAAVGINYLRNRVAEKAKN